MLTTAPKVPSNLSQKFRRMGAVTIQLALKK
jgi:hypothetical protein